MPVLIRGSKWPKNGFFAPENADFRTIIEQAKSRELGNPFPTLPSDYPVTTQWHLPTRRFQNTEDEERVCTGTVAPRPLPGSG